MLAIVAALEICPATIGGSLTPQSSATGPGSAGGLSRLQPNHEYLVRQLTKLRDASNVGQVLSVR